MPDTKPKKQAELSDTANLVLTELRNAEKPLTLAEIKAIVPGANSAHLTALRTRGLVNSAEVEVVVESKRTVLAYSVKAE